MCIWTPAFAGVTCLCWDDFLIESKKPQRKLRLLNVGARSRTKCVAFWARSLAKAGQSPERSCANPSNRSMTFL